MQEQNLVHHYRYAIHFLYSQNSFQHESDLYICAFLYSMEENGTIATPLKSFESLLSSYLKSLAFCPCQGSLAPLIEQFLNNTSLVSHKSDDEVAFIISNQLIYSRRSYFFEQELITTVNNFLLSHSPLDVADHHQTLAYLSQFATLNDPIVSATKTILSSNFLVLTGGPGFGKTTALAILLEGVLYLKHTEHQINYRMALAAPTGRAAARMMESLNFRDEFPLLRENISANALTLHRLLGYNNLTDRCHFNQDRPLPYDIIAVDEASMIDAIFFNHLLKAMKSSCKLILLGDPNQLPSIGRGAILSDLITGYHDENHLLHHHVVELTTCYRSDQTILGLATAALQGDYSSFTQIILEDINSHITTHSLITQTKLMDKLLVFYDLSKLPLATLFVNNYDHFTPHEVNAVKNFFNFYNSFIVLTPLRNGSPYSADELNNSINRHYSADKNYHGQPIMITANDEKLALANGDRGVVIKLPAGFFVFFEGAKHPILLNRISSWETAFAITIHKSQGSEFNEVAIIIPPHAGRVVSRKLLYTAITRAKKRVHFFKDNNEMKIAFNNHINRYSALPFFLHSAS